MYIYKTELHCTAIFEKKESSDGFLIYIVYERAFLPRRTVLNYLLFFKKYMYLRMLLLVLLC